MFGQKNTNLYKYNSVVATVGFFIVRILTIVPAWVSFISQRKEVYEFSYNSYLYYGTIIMLILSDLQNLDWCYRLYQSTLRSFNPVSAKSKTK